MGVKMLAFLTLIFVCQLVGEFFVSVSGLPIPGPVIGLATLFVGLLVHGSLPIDLGKAADVLITNLSLLFIPAGVGVLLHAQLIGTDVVPITISLIGSTLLTIAVTGSLMAWMDRFSTNGDRSGEGDSGATDD